MERARLKDDKLFLYTQKTGTPVYCPLPPEAVSTLQALANERPEYFFSDGKSERETTVKSWNRVFQKLFATAEPPIIGGHAHRFRDTFAISLLLKGVELSHVSILLGHSSVRVTERHYSPWVKGGRSSWKLMFVGLGRSLRRLRKTERGQHRASSGRARRRAWSISSWVLRMLSCSLLARHIPH